MKFDWTLIRSFLAVAETGSLSGAARDLAASQPTIGRHISELETQLGVTLFQRARSGMTLSETGLTLVDHAKQMQVNADALSIAATGQSQSIKGAIRITASEIVSGHFLPKILVDLLAQEKGLEIELVSSDAVQNLLRGDADIAIRMVAPSQSELIARKVNEMAIGVYAHRDYLARTEAQNMPNGLQDFSGHHMIGYDRQTLIIDGFAQMGYKAVREDFAVRCDSQPVYWQMLKAGAGIGFVSNALARTEPELVRLMPELDIPPIPMWITAHRELKTSLRVRRVFDFLVERLKTLDLS